jgi:phenylacetate-CoA ligase
MRELRLRPEDIRSSADLPRLPILTKADIRTHRAQLRSSAATRFTQYSTTGSTGEPLLFDLSKRRVGSRVACRQRVASWWGLAVGDPEFVIWGSPVELTKQDWVRAIRDTFLRTRLLSAFEISDETMTRYIEIIQRHGCKQIFGYPSAIALLAAHARNRGMNMRNLGIQAVFVTGEILWPNQREIISSVMNAPVADGYGGRDSGFISHECPQGGMHILADTVIVEVVDADGQPVAPGESGDIVVTDLYSHEVPFIRYATGDRGVLSTAACRCGRSLPLFEKIDGRAMDFFLTPDGRTIPGGSVFYAFYGIDGIDQFRVIQKTVDRFHVQIVRGQQYRLESEARIRDGLAKRMRAAVDVSFEYLERFPLERTGKFRCVMSEVPGLPTTHQPSELVNA